MKRIFQTLLSAALILALTVSLTPAFAEKGDEEPYDLYFHYLVAFEGPDQDEVSEAISELAMRDLNIRVHMIPMTFGRFLSQMSVMLVSNEPLDLGLVEPMYVSSYLDAGYLVNMKDYLEYAPDALEALGQDAYTATFDDFQFAFCCKSELSEVAGLIVRKDILNELGYEASDFDVNVDDYSSFDQITELFAKVKEKYPDMDCLDGTKIMGLQPNSYADWIGDGFGMLEDYGMTTTVTNWYESDQYRKFCDIAREWYLAGYTSPDIAINMDAGETKIKAGNCFAYIGPIKPNTAIEKESITGYEMATIPMSIPKRGSGYPGMLYSIFHTSKNPAKAMEFLNWTYSSQEFMDLLNWGIEGKHWVETEDGLAGYPEGIDQSSVGYHNDYGWAYPNQFIGHAWEGNPPDVWEQLQEYNDNVLRTTASGFVFNPMAVSDEIIQLNGVLEQYQKDLAFGVVEIEPMLKEFNDALYTAGLQNVIDEKQRQLDEWLASKDAD